MPAKSDKSSLDTLDQRLLSLLRKDARRPVSALADQSQTSRCNIYMRIELERAGIIAGYTVKLGETYVRRLTRAHVMIKSLPKFARAVEEQLLRMSALVALHAISGEYDTIAVIEAEDVAMLNELIDRIGDLEDVEKTISSILLASKMLGYGRHILKPVLWHIPPSQCIVL
jgi:DNA-binding Lrp family transcriptional regulator